MILYSAKDIFDGINSAADNVSKLANSTAGLATNVVMAKDQLSLAVTRRSTSNPSQQANNAYANGVGEVRSQSMPFGLSPMMLGTIGIGIVALIFLMRK